MFWRVLVCSGGVLGRSGLFYDFLLFISGSAVVEGGLALCGGLMVSVGVCAVAV